ncbi:Tryptophan biosynthesis protein TrpCF [Corynebacterium kalinowskii]|uniref:N-(5'-phosphoribosyl)anthranilate isomerase n=1 Tax=Corynebacterium kalinowskii TaxID=2675216 RepID=A0A6B8VJN5_9CORY|nr:bifunctional indole-3-glycerol-phosphate synthase TrpC/phosphoribosylanthranilate isomerase TrpF [Corynebacterium kalinowskii]QGU03269.1 Tryptophan biosynthesis protein TrpCF [Corynebacterium kalinowskii]
MVLDEIVTERRTHLPGIAELVAGKPLQKSTRSLEEWLAQPGPQFIMECKSASPSLGEIRGDYRPRELAEVYSRYAAGISVLCEPKWFKGSYAHLATVAATTHLPVLCKDFIVDEVQIRAARYFGADAVLLMLSVLTDEEYRGLAEVAASLQMDVLTEVVSEEEARRANALGARIVGINHRDLSDLSIDLTRSARLAPMLEASVVIGESGIRSHSVIQTMGFLDGFLVGSHLSGSADVESAVRELVYGDNKVCGLTRPEDAQVAYAAGATHGGLILVAESPRNVSRETCSAIMAAEPGLKYVAVTRTPDIDPTGFHAIQLHSANGTLEEEQALIAQARATGLEVWRAIDMTAEEGPQLAVSLAPLVDKLVLDTGQGGTGQSFDWSIIPAEVKGKALLAGGLNLDNLKAALQHEISLDLNSGFETSPGHKDPAALVAAFQMIKEHQ